MESATMKPNYLLPAGLLAVLATLAFTTVNADPEGGEGRGHMMCGGYGMHRGEGYGPMMGGGYGMHHGEEYARWKKSLSSEQRAKIDKMKLDFIKKQYPMKAKKKALKIELALLATADSPDMKAIDKKIDDLLALTKQMMQQKYAHKTAVRKELNDEQRVQFDIAMLKKAKHGKRCMHGPR
jgi:Spy/CpxP family protein refolding chaperone